MQPKSQGAIPGRYRSKYIEDAEVRASLAKQRLDAEKQHLENLKNLYIKG